MKKMCYLNKTIFILFVCILLWSSFNSTAQPFWMSDSGPYGGNISALVAKSNGDLIGGSSNGGVFVLAGPMWARCNDALKSNDVHALLIKNDQIYAGTDSGVFRLTNYGDPWISLNTGLRLLLITSLALNPIDGSIAAGTSDSGVFRTTNNGGNWNSMNNNLTSSNVLKLQYNSNGDLFAGTSTGGVFRLLHNDISWSQVNNGLTVFKINALAISHTSNSNGIIYCGSIDSTEGVFRSTDNGASWTSSKIFLLNRSISSLVVNDSNGTVYCLTGAGPHRSVDYGITWSNIRNGVDATDGNCLIVNDLGYVSAGFTLDGVYSSRNEGYSWGPNVHGMENRTIIGIVVNQENGKRFCLTDRRGLYYYDSGALFWIEHLVGIYNGSIFKNFSSMVIKPGTNIMYVCGEAACFYSSNNGTSWTLRNNGLTGVISENLTIDENNGEVFLATSGQKIYHTADEGLHWSETNNSGLNHSNIRTIVYSNSSGNLYCFAKVGFGVYRSTDRGNSWNMITNGLTDSSVTCLTVSEATISRGHLFIGTRDSGVFRSTNYGATWSRISTGLPNSSVRTIFIDTSGIVYIGMAGPNIFRSRDNGGTWEQISTGLLPGEITCIALRESDKILFAGSDNASVYRSVNPVPVELFSFTASVNNQDVVLFWKTASEKNNFGFEVQRRIKRQGGNRTSGQSFDIQPENSIMDDWKTIGFVAGRGTSTQLHDYSFTDKFPSTINTLPSIIEYRLKQIDIDGSWTYSQHISVDIFSPVSEARLEFSPDPVRKEVQLTYTIPNPSQVTLTLYDFLGREVQTIMKEFKETGTYSTQLQVRGISNGIYFIQLESSDQIVRRKMLVLR